MMQHHIPDKLCDNSLGPRHVTKSQTCVAWTNVPVNILIDIKFVQKYFWLIFQNKRKFKLDLRTVVKWLTLLLRSEVQFQAWYFSFFQWLRLLCPR